MQSQSLLCIEHDFITKQHLLFLFKRNLQQEPLDC